MSIIFKWRPKEKDCKKRASNLLITPSLDVQVFLINNTFLKDFFLDEGILQEYLLNYSLYLLYVPTYLSTHPPTHPPTYSSTLPPTYLLIYLITY